MRISTEKKLDAAVLHFAGPADTSAVKQVRRIFDQHLNAEGVHLVCDLGDVDFICSEALGAFISAHHLARSRGGYLRLARPQHRVSDILATTQLDTLFNIYDTVDAALKA